MIYDENETYEEEKTHNENRAHKKKSTSHEDRTYLSPNKLFLIGKNKGYQIKRAIKVCLHINSPNIEWIHRCDSLVILHIEKKGVTDRVSEPSRTTECSPSIIHKTNEQSLYPHRKNQTLPKD